MSKIVSKPEHGSTIGSLDEKNIITSNIVQTYFDDITDKLNTNLLGDSVIFPEYKVSTVPSPVNNTNGVIIISDEVGGRTLATSNGIDWFRVSDGVIIAE